MMVDHPHNAATQHPVTAQLLGVIADEMRPPIVTMCQLDFLEENLGKFRKQGKKRLTWTFQQQTNAPMVVSMGGPAYNATAAPTSQSVAWTTHSVSLTWSKKTGKFQIDMDGREMTFGRKPGAAVLAHAWTTTQIAEGQPSLLRLHLLATRKTPVHKVAADFRKYDLVLDGVLFAELPYSDGTRPPLPPTMTDVPSSIVQILYPDGYTWEDDHAEPS